MRKLEYCANGNNKKYVLITAAHNEESNVEKTIVSVANQSIKPLRWVIVDDRSSDATESILREYQHGSDFVEILKVTGDSSRNFGAQVAAINRGYESIKSLDYDYIGNLDADLSFEANYFEELLSAFQSNPSLGLTGGEICEQSGGEFRPRKFNNDNSVPHAVQMFSRPCFDCIGGYKPLKYGGPDWYAEVMARLQGWDVQTTKGLYVYHHRPTSGAENVVTGAVRAGFMAYSLGSHPLFEIMKAVARLQQKPYIVYSLIKLSAYFWSVSTGRNREASDDFVKYLRTEQLLRIKRLFAIKH